MPAMPREALLSHPDTLECTLYRANEENPEAEELDLGDGHIRLLGAFQAPPEWDALACEEYFADMPAEAFVTAQIDSAANLELGDYVAVVSASGQVSMYYVYDWLTTSTEPLYVLIQDDEELD